MFWRLLSCWQACRVVVHRLSTGGMLVLLGAAGTTTAALLWLEVGLTVAAIAYALILALFLFIIHHLASAEARSAPATYEIISENERQSPESPSKKVTS